MFSLLFLVLTFLLVSALVVCFLQLILWFDSNHNLQFNRRITLGFSSVAIVVSLLVVSKADTIIEIVTRCFFAAYLIVTSFVDMQTKTVHDFLHFIAGLSGIILLVGDCPKKEYLTGCILFVILQMLVFSKMYGLADCYLFSVCSLFIAAGGHGIEYCLLHMLLAICLLAVVQIKMHNINKKGNLKQAVAFVPYIAIAIWPFL